MALGTSNHGARLIATNFTLGGDCVQLSADDSPGLAYQLAAGEVKIATGSDTDPIHLPNLFSAPNGLGVGNSFPSLVIMGDDGQLMRLNAPTGNHVCKDLKLSAKAGRFYLEEDTINDIVSADICITDNCEDVDYVMGVNVAPQLCGAETRDVLQLKLIPRDCYNCYCESEPEEGEGGL